MKIPAVLCGAFCVTDLSLIRWTVGAPQEVRVPLQARMLWFCIALSCRANRRPGS